MTRLLEHEGPGAAVDAPEEPVPGERALVKPGAALGSRLAGLAHPRIVAAGAVALLAAAAVLHFFTTSGLWLDEALTVNIARHPFGQITGLLRHDGAPPLYYWMLHYWMAVFGTSGFAVRSLSGVISLAALPFVWAAALRVGGRSVAWAALLLAATSPFGVYYATENRMYSLVILLSATGLLALHRAIEKPSLLNLAAVGLSGAGLLYSQYWALYLVAVVGTGLTVASVRGARRRNARLCLAAVAFGCVAFLPWVPTFLYQAVHTGTPWAQPTSYTAVIHAITQFAGGNTVAGRLLGIVYFLLILLAIFGVAIDEWRVEMDIRSRRRVRLIGLATVGTLLVALTGGVLTKTGYSDRYTAVVFVPCVIVVAAGVDALGSRRAKVAMLAAAAVFGLWGSTGNAIYQRTEATLVAGKINALARPGDLVVYCPDQLGPAVSRLVTADVVQLTYPLATGPGIVNWVDYAKRNTGADPNRFAESMLRRAGPRHTIFYVWEEGYLTFGEACEQQIQYVFASARPKWDLVVPDQPHGYYEHEHLTVFPAAPGAG